MSSTVTLRPATRQDISALAHLANASNAKSVLHKRIAPGQDKYPLNYYNWRLNIIRQRFATPDLRTIIAEDSSTGQILGQASWAIEGSDTPLYKSWVGETSSWAQWIELKTVLAEKKWARYVKDRCIDYEFLDRFMAAFLGSDRAVRPACLHCHLIVVDPDAQGRGVGKLLMDWGKELVVKEDLPLFLESNLEATGFYEKSGFSKLSRDVVVGPDGKEPIRIPAFVWEGKERQGRWLERDTSFEGEGERWRWRDDVLPKN